MTYNKVIKIIKINDRDNKMIKISSVADPMALFQCLKL